jgi:hypothetical protein
MKTYKYSTKERAERVAKSLGCTGSHHHNEDGGKKYMPCKDMKTFKEKTKNNKKGKEEEVTELVDFDGTWLSSDVPILDPASSLQGSTFTDKIVPMSRNPRDPLLRGWYGYFGENEVKEEDMSSAFGYEDTKDLNFDDTLKHYKKELSLDNEKALERTIQQGKKKELSKRKKTPAEIKKKKGFIDTLIIKELEDDIKEDTIFKKDDRDNDLNKKVKEINPLLLKNIRAIKKMAEKMGVPLSELIKALKNE